MNIISPEAELTYCHLGLPDTFKKKTGVFNCVATFNHDDYTQEQKRDLFNFLCYIVKAHPNYDNTKKPLDQFEELNVGTRNEKGHFQIKPKQDHIKKSYSDGKENTYVFKVQVKSPDGDLYGLPNIGAKDPWVGVMNAIPMFGKGTRGKVVIDTYAFKEWTDREGNKVPEGVGIRLKSVEITNEVQYQSKPQENKVTESPKMDGFDDDVFNVPVKKKEEDILESSSVDNFDSFDDDIPF